MVLLGAGCLSFPHPIPEGTFAERGTDDCLFVEEERIRFLVRIDDRSPESLGLSVSR